MRRSWRRGMTCWRWYWRRGRAHRQGASRGLPQGQLALSWGGMGELARILVVDDDLASRGLMAQILAEDGHKVTDASDDDEALNHLRVEQKHGGAGLAEEGRDNRQ